MGAWKGDKRIDLRGYKDVPAFLFLPSDEYPIIRKEEIPGDIFALDGSVERINPDYWITMGDYDPYWEMALRKHCRKVLRKHYQKVYSHIEDVYFLDAIKPQKGIEDTFLLNGDNIFFVWFRHTISTALHLLVVMGYKKIYLYSKLAGYKDYTTILFLNEFKSISDKYGIELISVNEKTQVNGFMRYEPFRNLMICRSEVKAGCLKE